ncbi:CHAT domain-containing protein [Spirosoma harenae]
MKVLPLHLLCLVLLTLSATAQINPQLLLAIQQNNPQALSAALSAKARANPNATDSLGATPLMWACYKADTPLVKILLQAGAKPECRGVIRVDASTNYGNLTSIAAGLNKLPLLRYLVDTLKLSVNEAGYNPITKKNDGWTPAEWAASKGDADILRYLAERGADLQVGQGNVMVLTVAHNKFSITSILLERGITLNKKHPRFNEVKDGYLQQLFAGAIVLGNLGRFRISILAFEQLRDYYKEEFKREDETYAMFLHLLGGFYYLVGEFDNAIQSYKQAKTIRGKVLSTAHPDYAASVSNLALMYVAVGQYEDALTLYEETLVVIVNSKGKNSPEYAGILNNQGELYQLIEQHEKALQLYQEALGIMATFKDTKPTDYATVLNNIGLLHHRMSQYEKSLTVYLEALAIMENYQNYPGYSQVVNNLAMLYLIMERYEKALPLFEKALSIREKTFGNTHSKYGESLNNLAELYRYMSQYDKALPLYQKALVIVANAKGKKHSDYATVLDNMGKLYENMGQPMKAFPFFQEADQINQQNLMNTFGFISSSQQANYVQENEAVFTSSYSFALRHRRQQADLAGWAYNNALFHNGLLLNASQQLNRTIAQSTNPAIRQTFAQLQQAKTWLYAQWSLPAEKQVGLPQLEAKADSLEQILTRQSQAFRDFHQNAQIQWPQVQKRLGRNEAAIEFVAFRYSNKQVTDSTLYAAFLLRPGYNQPKLVHLFEERQLAKLLDYAPPQKKKEEPGDLINNIYRAGPIGVNSKDESAQLTNGQELSQLIWQPLDSLLQGVDIVYFSPAGRLHEVAFSALRYPNPKRAGSLTFRQLFSTRLLAQVGTYHSQLPAQFSAQLIGDIDYDNSPISSSAQSAASQAKTNTGEFPWLEHSGEELNNLKQQLHWLSVDQVWRKKAASEPQVKSLSGKSVDVLHFSTHTFSRNTAGSQPSGRSGKKTALQGDSRVINPLFQTGLALAGANRATHPKIPGSEVDEGLLYAQEVAEMDLSRTSLVCLAACRTGLGQVHRSEGVYGLARAFKLAGVRFLILSLWNVEDKATSEFMSRFYQKLSESRDVRKAFEATQADYRKNQPNDPYKWAFVLVE